MSLGARLNSASLSSRITRSLAPRRAQAFLVCRASSASASVMATTETPQQLISRLNHEYEKVHKSFEDNFWATKMALKGNSTAELTRTKNEYESWLGNADTLKAVREAMKDPSLSEEQRGVLAIMEKTFKCYIIEDPKSKELKEKVTDMESELGRRRNEMALGYTDPQADKFVKASSVQLRNTMRVHDHEPTRKACWEGLRSIGPFVAEQFLEIVKARNKLARSMGYEDYYDYKVTVAEGFGKTRLFEILDDLESKTRPLMEKGRAALAEAKGPAALEPWNIGQALAGETEKALDPYFPFEDAVDVWARTFAALGINYKGATMTLDLCDRDGKYSNGFCHWPQPAWRKDDGTWVASRANFTSLATPSQVGSGKTALATLLHEGGHAAHFANIDQASPLFAQERPPFSVATAENQSMFLDSFESDAAWLGRYARSREGQVVPWDVLEAHMTATHPYEVFSLRAMLAVPYLEKALYEMPESELSMDVLLALADRIEKEVQGGLSSRPLMSVPHILADESSCYYHGYVLAEMSVHQTRAHFKAKYGAFVDNPKVGADLARAYWQPGNSATFLQLVEGLTGRPLSADAWVEALNMPLKQLLEEEKADYEQAVAAGPAIKPGNEADLGMRVVLVHGDQVISDSKDGGLQAACTKFKSWVNDTYFKKDA